MIRMNAEGWRARAGWDFSKLALVVGYLSLGAAILAAHNAPATRYEVSLYRATPLLFWIGFALATALSLLIAWTEAREQITYVALTLYGTAVAAFLALPLVRGYHFYGHADPMTHLGWARDMSAGVLSPPEMLYPGIHTVTVFLHSTVGLGLTRAMMLVVWLFGVLFLLAVPLCVRVIYPSRRAVVLAVVAASMLLPINQVSTHLRAHPFTQTTLFSSFVLLVVLLFLRQSDESWSRSSDSIGPLVALVAIAAVLYHPQQALCLFLLFVGISAFQLVRSRTGGWRPERPLYLQTGLFGAIFVGWNVFHRRWIDAPITNLKMAALGYVTDSPPTPGGNVASQTSSLSSIGVGLGEMYVKLFLVDTVFLVLAGLLVLAVLFRRIDPDIDRRFVEYLALGGVMVVPVVLFYFVTNVAEHFLRIFGYVMLLVTILGALYAARLCDRAADGGGRRLATAAKYGVPLVVALLLPLAILTAFPSPFVYKANGHVTEAQMDGYRTVFEYNDESYPLGGVRERVLRYSDAIDGTTRSRPYDIAVSSANVTRLDTRYDTHGYLVVTRFDVRRETEAYHGLKYDRAAFASLPEQTGVSRVVSNRDVTLYYT